MFELPLFYQYRLGSTGFGAWRELAALTTATRWVLGGECASFPVLYHHEVIVRDSATLQSQAEEGELESSVQYWGNVPAVRRRLEALQKSRIDLVLFLEYIPQTLHQWFLLKLAQGGTQADTALAAVDNELKQVTDCLALHNVVHFDCHWQNILCDGSLYVSDFGLALSSAFSLEADEQRFLERHRSYDRAVTIVSLIQCFMEFIDRGKRWQDALLLFLQNSEDYGHLLTPYQTNTVKRYAPVAQAMAAFYSELHTGDKLAIYPDGQMQKLIAEADLTASIWKSS